MRKRFAFISSFIVLLACVGMAFSSWYVLTTQTEKQSEKVLRDDIKENYSYSEGNKKIIMKQYTIYLFPSTIYLNDYLDYLEGTSSTKPEDLYGCLEPKYDLANNVVTDSNGNTVYTFNTPTNSNNLIGDQGYIKKVRSETYNDLYLDRNANNVYDTYYSSNSEWNQANYYSIDGSTFNRCYIGDPELDKTQKMTNYNSDSGEKYLNRNQHRYDRFGFWSDTAYENGRFLPIKIDVDANFSYETFEKVSKKPYTSMGDSNGWYNYTFPSWVYVEHSNSNYYLPSFVNTIKNSDDNRKENIRGAFRSYDVARYFDLMKSFDLYADSDNVIRLFPIYSNGKNPNAGSNVSHGGRDAVRMQAEYHQSSNSDYDDKYIYTMYKAEQLDNYTESGVTTSSIKVAMYSNLNINRYKSITYQIAWSYGSCSWGGDWPSFYKIEESVIEKIKNLYGDGLYNFYLFVGNSALSSNQSSNNAIFTNLPEKIASSTGSDRIFTKLSGKVLITLDDLGSSTSSDLTYLGAKNNGNNNVANRPIRLCIEKIRTIKIITGVDDNSSEQDIQNIYNNTSNVFRFINEDIYEIPAGNTIVNNINSATPLNQTYPYCYIIRNIDFTELSSKYLQVRLQRRYRKDLIVVGTDGPLTGNDPAPNTDIIFNPTKVAADDLQPGQFYAEQRFVNAFGSGDNGIFEPIFYTPDGSSDSQIFLKLKNEDMLGIYDFLLVYRPTETKSKGHTFKKGIYIYAYRHTSLFLKILANDIDQDDDGYCQHVTEKWTSDNALLFQKQYPIGVQVKATDLNEEQGYVSENYNSWCPVSQVNETLESCINNYVDNLPDIKNNNKSKKDVIIRDHVTQSIIAYYTAEEKFVVNNFKSRKNYIFYVTYI